MYSEMLSAAELSVSRFLAIFQLDYVTHYPCALNSSLM